MTREIKTVVGVIAVGVLGFAGYLLTSKGPEPKQEAALEAAPAGVGETVLASSTNALPRSGRFSGEWEQVSGTAQITCNGKLTKEVPVAGKRFKILDQGGALTFSDDSCDVPLKVEGNTAVAATESCTGKRNPSQSFKINKQSIESDGKLGKLVFEADFQVTPARVEKSMDCKVVLSSTARRL